MSLPIDQVVRERRFLAAHPEWNIIAMDRGSRFTAECGEPGRMHIVAGLSLRELLDKLEKIVGGVE